MKPRLRSRLHYPILILLLAASAIASLCLGAAPIPLRALWEAATGSGDSITALVLWEIRLPRLILALLAGGSLGLAGAAMQGLLRNPLVEPGLLGVSAGAALGAVVAFYSGAAALFALALPFAGMFGAALAVALVLLAARRTGSIQSLILAGVAITAVCGAMTSLALNLSPNPYAALEIVFWLLGSVADRTRDHVVLVAPLVVVGSVLLLQSGGALRAMSLGEETAQSLGYSIKRARLQIILGTALAVGAVVSVCGAIGFVGLIVPHLMRPWVKGDPARLLPLSALGGALLLLWADMAVRLLPTNQELKLGVITSLLGAPLFLLLMLRSRRNYF